MERRVCNLDLLDHASGGVGPEIKPKKKCKYTYNRGWKYCDRDHHSHQCIREDKSYSYWKCNHCGVEWKQATYFGVCADSFH